MKFFVPFAESPDQAERVYASFVQNHGYPVVGQSVRLFRVTFSYHGRSLVAEVGKEVTGFPEPAGPVIGIVESPELLTIHTQLRGGLSATPILVSPGKVSERIYFEDPDGRS